jgi:hypothetical protein
MADNTPLNEGFGGDTITTAETTFSGDVTKTQIVGLGVVTGSAESYSVALVDATNPLPTSQLIDDTVYVDDAAWTDDTSKHLLAGGIYQSTQQTITDGRTGPLQVNNRGEIIEANSESIDGNTTAIMTATEATQAAVEIMDDWDESNRAMVNPIVGQAGIAAGEGVDGVTVPRMTLATDVALPAGNNNIGNVDVVTVGSVVDANNSSVAQLGNGAVFTGTGTDMLGYTAAYVTVHSDEDSADGGISLQLSTDNSNWDDVHTYTLDASFEMGTRRFPVPMSARYFRFVYTNSTATTGELRIQTILHTGTPTEPLHRLDEDESPDRSATLVKSVIMAIGAGGSPDFIPIAATNGGNLKISVEESVSVAVTNGGTFVVQENGAALTALQLIDDTVAVLGTATYSEGSTKGSIIGAVRNDDLATLADTDNEVAPIQVDELGALFVNPCKSQPIPFSVVAASSGANELIAAVGSRKIRIHALAIFGTAATVTNIFVYNVDNDLLGNTGNRIPIAVDADGDNSAGFVLGWNPGGWFETDVVNEAVSIDLSAAQDVIVTGTYTEVL